MRSTFPYSTIGKFLLWDFVTEQRSGGQHARYTIVILRLRLHSVRVLVRRTSCFVSDVPPG